MSAKKKQQTDLAAQLRQAIRDSGVTLYRVAVEADVDRAMLSRFVTNERDITLRTASRLADYLGLGLRKRR